MAVSLRGTRRASGLLLAVLGTTSGAAAQPIPVGSQFQVNTHTLFSQGSPSVAADADGAFVVVWSFARIKGQRYDSAGSAVGSEFEVNTYTFGSQGFPSVAAAAGGDFVVVWEGGGSGGDYRGIHGRRYDSSGSPFGSEFQVNIYTTNLQGYPAVAAETDGDFVVVWQSFGSSGGDTDFYSIQGQCYDSAGSPVGSQFPAWLRRRSSAGSVQGRLPALDAARQHRLAPDEGSDQRRRIREPAPLAGKAPRRPGLREGCRGINRAML
jgi:hypothetical protein